MLGCSITDDDPQRLIPGIKINVSELNAPHPSSNTVITGHIA